MKRADIVKLICEREGKKSQVKIGDVREILKIIIELELEYMLGKSEQSILESLMEEAASKCE